MTLNSELIELVSHKLLIKQDVCKSVIETYIDMLQMSLMDDEEVRIPGFGRFKLYKVKGHYVKAHNFVDGQKDEYWVEDHRRVGFVPSKILKKKVWPVEQ